MVVSNYVPGIGGLAANRYDVQSHFEGLAFRHNSDQIDINPPVEINNGSYTVLNTALSAISSYITQALSNGEGFVTIGDGYNSWANANGSINFDGSVPPLDSILNPVFSAIVNSTPLPSGFDRIKYGGIIVIKAGTYIVENTINVPPGIILLGEGYGTKIINATSLNLTQPVTPPVSLKLSPTPAPVFSILADTNRSSDDLAVEANIFMFARETYIMNMVIADNFVEPTVLGDTLYKLPQNITGANPLIQQIPGSNLTMENVKLIGRVTFSSGTVVASATNYAIGLQASTPAPSGTILRVSRCMIDGFNQPINFVSTNGALDFIDVSDNRIRSHGYLNADNAAVSNNCIIQTGYCNINATNNFFYGNADVIQAGIFVSNTSPSAPSLQERAKVIVSSNNSLVNKLSDGTISNATNTTYAVAIFDSGYSSVATYFSSIIANNNFQDVASTAINASDLGSGMELIVGSAGVEITGNLTVDGTFNLPLGSLSLSDITVTTAEIGTATITTDNISTANIDIAVINTGVLNGTVTVETTSTFLVQGLIQYPIKSISTADSPYTVDTGSPDYFIFIDSSSGAVTINLPNPEVTGRTIVFKVISFTNAITLVPFAAETIEGLAANYPIDSPYQVVTLQSDLTNWWIVN